MSAFPGQQKELLEPSDRDAATGHRTREIVDVVAGSRALQEILVESVAFRADLSHCRVRLAWRRVTRPDQQRTRHYQLWERQRRQRPSRS